MTILINSSRDGSAHDSESKTYLLFKIGQVLFFIIELYSLVLIENSHVTPGEATVVNKITPWLYLFIDHNANLKTSSCFIT